MARKKREKSKTGVYHILLRGVDALFLTDSDFDCFMQLLKEKLTDKGYTVISYLLLENRVHLVVDAKNDDIGIVVKPLCTSYARYCNRTRASDGKLFYDRFRSEPINGAAELESVVAFVNMIAVRQGSGGYSSFENPICSAKEAGLSEKSLKNTEISKMFIEDYDCLSRAELGYYIYSLCGVYPDAFKALEKDRQQELCEKLTANYWISKSKIYDILGIRRNAVYTPKKPHITEDSEPKETPQKPKKDLSFWLL